jgi:hypothetical protein
MTRAENDNSLPNELGGANRLHYHRRKRKRNKGFDIGFGVRDCVRRRAGSRTNACNKK